MSDTSTVYLLGYQRAESDSTIRSALARLGGLEVLPRTWLIRFGRRLGRDSFVAELFSAGIAFYPDDGLFIAELSGSFWGKATVATDDAISAFLEGDRIAPGSDPSVRQQ